MTRNGPGSCARCGAPIVWARTRAFPDRPADFDLEPAPADWAGRSAELYTEVFPDGSPVDGIQWLRPRPINRPASSPRWRRHQCPEAPAR